MKHISLGWLFPEGFLRIFSLEALKAAHEPRDDVEILEEGRRLGLREAGAGGPRGRRSGPAANGSPRGC